MKGVDDKRRFLVQVKLSAPPFWLLPLLRFSWARRLWTQACVRKVSLMPVGEVLDEAYEHTAR